MNKGTSHANVKQICKTQANAYVIYEDCTVRDNPNLNFKMCYDRDNPTIIFTTYGVWSRAEAAPVLHENATRIRWLSIELNNFTWTYDSLASGGSQISTINPQYKSKANCKIVNTGINVNTKVECQEFIGKTIKIEELRSAITNPRPVANRSGHEPPADAAHEMKRPENMITLGNCHSGEIESFTMDWCYDGDNPSKLYTSFINIEKNYTYDSYTIKKNTLPWVTKNTSFLLDATGNLVDFEYKYFVRDESYQDYIDQFGRKSGKCSYYQVRPAISGGLHKIECSCKITKKELSDTPCENQKPFLIDNQAKRSKEILNIDMVR